LGSPDDKKITGEVEKKEEEQIIKLRVTWFIDEEK